MKSLEFINSKDVREYLEKINWQPDAVCSAWLIFQSKNHTLDEKFSAWEELMTVCKDAPLPKHNETSLFEFLKNYIEKTPPLSKQTSLPTSDTILTFLPFFFNFS